jgi:hypothetical protein
VTAKENLSREEIGKMLFDEPFWPVKRVIAWIAFRHEACLKASLSAGSWIVAGALWRRRDVYPEGTLLRTLQEGSVPALKDGVEVAREFWAVVRDDELPPVHFRREDVLKVWPRLTLKKSEFRERSRTTSDKHPKTALAASDILPIPNKPGNPPVKTNEAIAAMRAAVERGDVSEQQLRQMKQKSLSKFYPGAKRTLLAAARRRALEQIATERRQNADIKPTNDK